MTIHRASHSVFDLNYHLAWATKYRKYILSSRQCGWAKKFLKEIAEEYDFQISAMEVLPDHVHLLISVPPRYSTAQIARILKSKSAREMFNKFPDLRRHYHHGELWIDGYFVRSVGARIDTALIKKYIKEQRQGMLF